MNIIKITGKACSGKTTALYKLADHAPVMCGSEVARMMPALQDKAIALAPETFIDEVSERLLVELETLAKLYPSNYCMTVVMEA